ncbi:MAG: hypothetical protein ACRDTU_17100 [Micromonosporaceae bacterium]
MSEEERTPYAPRRRYDRAPAPVKVAVSLIYIQTGLLLLGALALNVTLARTPGGETGRWPWTAVVAGVAVLYAVLAYRLLQAQAWARVATIGLTWVSIGLGVVFFQPWFCVGILFGVVLIAGLMVPESRQFFDGTYHADDAEADS